jgi:hypothetical protein
MFRLHYYCQSTFVRALHLFSLNFYIALCQRQHWHVYSIAFLDLSGNTKDGHGVVTDGKRCTTIYIHHSNIFLLVFHGPSLSSSASSSSHFTTQLLIDVCQLSTPVVMIPPPSSISPSFYPHYVVEERRRRTSQRKQKCRSPKVAGTISICWCASVAVTRTRSATPNIRSRKVVRKIDLTDCKARLTIIQDCPLCLLHIMLIFGQR